MVKYKLSAEDINDWKRDYWVLYTSTSLPWIKGKTKLLRMWINGNGWYRVTFGGDILYEGTQITHAIAAWDAA